MKVMFMELGSYPVGWYVLWADGRAVGPFHSGDEALAFGRRVN